ncbi:ABC transporter substrate-binding protein, partial [Marinitoga litoralis]|uniref:ABC transporter substrate-binding protein n=1 Tax=Marinitoga litoralis TaxID=570855 RepID=UPI001EF9A3BE
VKKVLLVSLLLLVIAFSFGEKIKVEFWHAMGGGHGKTLEELVATFNRENPYVEIVPVYVGNYGALSRKLLSTVVAYNEGSRENLPVLAQAYSNWTSKYLQSEGIVEPLNKFIFGDAEFKNIWENQIYDVFKDMCTWGDTVYSIPFNKSVYTNYYNVDLFDLYGVEPPKTLDELYEVASLLTEDLDGDGTIDQYGLGYRTTVDDFQTFLYAMNGKILDYAGNGKWKIVLNKETTLKTLEFMYKLKADEVAMVQGGYLNDPFGNGQIAMYMGTIAGKPYVESSIKGKYEWSWAPLPSVDGVPHSPIAGTDLIMFAWASKEQKQAAWMFMNFLLDKVNQAYWSVNTGYVPVRKDVVDTPQWKSYVANDEKPAIALNSLATATPDPKPAAWYDIRNALGSIVNDFLYDKIAAEDAYNRMIEEMKNLLIENEEYAE